MRNKGFTLIELLAVVTILGLLSVILIPKILEIVKRDEESVNTAKETVIKSAADTYIYKNLNDYPLVNGNVYCIELTELEDSGVMVLDIENIKSSGINYVKVSVKESDNVYSLVENCQEKKK